MSLIFAAAADTAHAVEAAGYMDWWGIISVIGTLCLLYTSDAADE